VRQTTRVLGKHAFLSPIHEPRNKENHSDTTQTPGGNFSSCCVTRLWLVANEIMTYYNDLSGTPLFRNNHTTQADVIQTISIQNSFSVAFSISMFSYNVYILL
jgi:hypothetical protein